MNSEKEIKKLRKTIKNLERSKKIAWARFYDSEQRAHSLILEVAPQFVLNENKELYAKLKKKDRMSYLFEYS